MRIACAVALLLCCVGLVFAADVNGKWKATAQTPDGQEMPLVFTFKADGEKVTGTVESPMGELPISEGKLTGDAIEFTVEVNDQKIVHKGTVAGDEMKLKVIIGDQTMDMTAKRAAS
jgi:hypothetical protein